MWSIYEYYATYTRYCRKPSLDQRITEALVSPGHSQHRYIKLVACSDSFVTSQDNSIITRQEVDLHREYDIRGS